MKKKGNEAMKIYLLWANELDEEGYTDRLVSLHLTEEGARAASAAYREAVVDAETGDRPKWESTAPVRERRRELLGGLERLRGLDRAAGGLVKTERTRREQRTLNAPGHGPMPEDGIDGPKTKRARKRVREAPKNTAAPPYGWLAGEV